MRDYALVALILACVACSAVPGDGIAGCTGHESPFELIDHEPTLVAEVANGRKYTYGIKTILFQTMMEENSMLYPLKEQHLKWDKHMEHY